MMSKHEDLSPIIEAQLQDDARRDLSLDDLARLVKITDVLCERFPESIRIVDLCSATSLDRSTVRRTLDRLQALLGDDYLPNVGLGLGVCLKEVPKGFVERLAKVFYALRELHHFRQSDAPLRFHVAAPGLLANRLLWPILDAFRRALYQHDLFKDRQLELRVTHMEVGKLISHAIYDPAIDCVVTVHLPDSLADSSIGQSKAEIKLHRCLVFPTADPLQSLKPGSSLFKSLEKRCLAHLEGAKVASYHSYPWRLVRHIGSSPEGSTISCRRHSEILAAIRLSTDWFAQGPADQQPESSTKQNSSTKREGFKPSDYDEVNLAQRKTNQVVGLAFRELLDREDVKTCGFVDLKDYLNTNEVEVPIRVAYRSDNDPESRTADPKTETTRELIKVFVEQFEKFGQDLKHGVDKAQLLDTLLQPMKDYKHIHISTLRKNGKGKLERCWVSEPVRLWVNGGLFVKGFRWRRMITGENPSNVKIREVFARVTDVRNSATAQTETLSLAWRETERNERGLTEFIASQAAFIAQFTFDVKWMNARKPIVGRWMGSVRGETFPFESWVMLSTTEIADESSAKELNDQVNNYLEGSRTRDWIVNRDLPLRCMKSESFD